MKKIISLILFSQIAYAQNFKNNEKVQVDSITVMDIKRVLIGNGDVYEEQRTTTRKLSNAVDFFPDNIILPIAPNNPNITNISQVTLDNMDPDLRAFIENANKSFRERFQLVSNKLVIEATATSERATTDVPEGYSEEQVKLSYKDPTKPNNQDLMIGRANNLKIILLKFIPELNNLLKSGKITLSVSTKTASKRYVKVVGLEFSQERKFKKIKNQFKCGDNIGVNQGTQGIQSKNWLYIDGQSSDNYTRAIFVMNTADKAGNNRLTKSAKVEFDAWAVPDRCEIYTMNSNAEIKLIDDCSGAFIGRLSDTAVISHAEKLKELNIPYGVKNLSGYTKEIKIEGSDITHILVNVYSPLKGTKFDLKISCNF